MSLRNITCLIRVEEQILFLDISNNIDSEKK